MVLFSHEAEDVRWRADESDMGRFADLSEVGILGEKPIPRMDGVHIGDFRGADDVRDVQIAIPAARRTDADGFVGKANVEGIPVRLRIHCHGGNA